MRAATPPASSCCWWAEIALAHPRPSLAALSVADAPERWRALGFTVAADGRFALGGIEIRLGGAGAGITGWTLRDLPPRAGEVDVDGLATAVTTSVAPPPDTHPNGAIGLDHVVIVTPAFDRTAAALDQAGLTLRRIRLDDASAARSDEVGSGAGGRPAEGAGGFRQGFRRLGPAIMEIVEGPRTPPGPARFWGLVVVVADLEALRERLHPCVKEIRPAVQPGRQIATLSASAGLGCAVAFMDPP